MAAEALARSAIVGALLVAVCLQACAPAPQHSQTDSARARDSIEDPAPPGADSAVIEGRAREVLAALKSRDGARLAALVHPLKGVRFSPHAFVHVETDVVIPRDSVAGLFVDSTSRLWGHKDGSGFPINGSFATYYRQFVYAADFGTAKELAFDRPPIRGSNTPSNLRDVYPSAHWMEFHFPGFDARYRGMDWRSLWLVFEQEGSDWFVVGVVHGSWTI